MIRVIYSVSKCTIIMYLIAILLQSFENICAVSTELKSNEIVEETQHAICKIATEEIQATANASITRQLKGICHSDDMHKTIQQLEKRIAKQLADLQNTLARLIRHMNKLVPETKENEEQFYYKRLSAAVMPTEVPITKSPFYTTEKSVIMPTETVMAPREDSANYEKELDLEILQFNNTIFEGDYGDTFAYYWLIEDVVESFLNEDVFQTSSHFYFKGTSNYIKFSPRHHGSKYACIELVNLSPTFFYKYRFILPKPANRREDLNSQLLCRKPSFAQMYRTATHNLKKCVFNNTIVIKLLIYLDL